jgi:hypothetical protein
MARWRRELVASAGRVKPKMDSGILFIKMKHSYAGSSLSVLYTVQCTEASKERT